MSGRKRRDEREEGERDGKRERERDNWRSIHLDFEEQIGTSFLRISHRIYDSIESFQKYVCLDSQISTRFAINSVFICNSRVMD